MLGDIEWIKNNVEWLFDGVGTEIISIVCMGTLSIIGWRLRKIFRIPQNESKEKNIDNGVKCENISGDRNIVGNNNTITIYESNNESKDEIKREVASDKYVKAKELDKKVIMNLERRKIKVSESEGIQDLTLYFKNITNNVVTSINIIPSEVLVKELEGIVWKRNQESKVGVIITQYELMAGNINVNENKEFEYMLRYKTYNSPFLLICFCVKTKSIYGIETVQFFNIVVTGGIINRVFTETEY